MLGPIPALAELYYALSSTTSHIPSFYKNLSLSDFSNHVVPANMQMGELVVG